MRPYKYAIKILGYIAYTDGRKRWNILTLRLTRRANFYVLPRRGWEFLRLHLKRRILWIFCSTTAKHFPNRDYKWR